MMMTKIKNNICPYYLANRTIDESAECLEVTDKYSGGFVANVPMAGAAEIQQAIAAAVNAARPMRQMKSYERQAVLTHCVDRLTDRAEEFAQTLTIEVGKPIKDARGEVG